MLLTHSAREERFRSGQGCLGQGPGSGRVPRGRAMGGSRMGQVGMLGGLRGGQGCWGGAAGRTGAGMLGGG